MKWDSFLFSSAGALKEEIWSKRHNCKWKLEYVGWFQESKLKLIKPSKEKTWNLLWWNSDDKLEFVGDILD